MMFTTTRRRFLAGTAAGAASVLLPAGAARAQPGQAILGVNTRTIEVLGHSASVYSLDNASGGQGLTFNEGDRFNVRLDSYLGEPTLIHWHGLAGPWRQDGVPGITSEPLGAGESIAYDFALKPAGTHWMHSHFGLQEQAMLAAPLIIRRKSEVEEDRQEVVIMLHDFSFTPAEEIMANLMAGLNATGTAPHHHTHGAAAPAAAAGAAPMAGMAHDHGSMAGMSMGSDGGTMTMPMSGDMSGMQMGGGNDGMPGMQMGDGGSMAMPAGIASGDMAPMPMGGDSSGMATQNEMGGMVMDLNDVDYDAYLANDRTLDDPEVVQVERGGRVRLRIINGASSTAFLVDLGGATGRLDAVDGSQVQPVSGSVFPVAIAQRLDILLDMPSDGSALPILMRREGAVERTGIILAPPGAAVAKIEGKTPTAAPAIDFAFEAALRARAPLAARPADRSLTIDLFGAMQGYVWSIGGTNGGLTVREGERVEITMHNSSGMAHPMHLHGHTFQVVALDGQRFPGAMRDTVLVPAGKSVTIAFDADNPGRWVFHCHNLYHMEAGMVTTVAYDAYS